jgi:hypothetical protein
LFSINVKNKHFGAPTNPAAFVSSTWRINIFGAGGSSGLGVDVAGGNVEFALGKLIFVCFLFKQDVSL